MHKIIFTLIFLSSLQALAQNQGNTVETVIKPKEGDKPPEVTEKVKLGVVAGSFKGGQAQSLDVESGGEVPGEDDSVISASISHIGPLTCVAKVVNGGKKAYSVSFVAKGVSRSGVEEFSKSFSGSIAPGATLEKRISDCKPGSNLSVNLRSAKARD